MVAPTAADALSKCENKSDPDIASCSEVIASEEKSSDRLGTAHVYRGIGYSMKGLRNRALADFNEAIRLDPKIVYAAYTNRGAIFMLQDKADLALADFDEAIRREPRDALAFSNRGWLKSLAHKNDEAILDLDRAIQLNPGFANAYRIAASR